jgi:hypothetical protein
MTGQKLLELIRKNLLCVICVAISLVLGGVIYLRSGLVSEAEATLADRSSEGERLQANVENSEKLKEQYAALVAANQTIQYRLIRQGELAENLQHFYKLEADTSVKIADLRQTGIPPKKKGEGSTNFVPIGFSVSVQGDYPAVIDFLRRVESGSPYCRILTATLSPFTPTDRSGPVGLTIELQFLGLP